MQKLCFLTLSLLLSMSPAHSQEQARRDLVEPRFGPLLIDDKEVTIEQLESIMESRTKPTRIHYVWIECNVSWTQSCSGRVPLSAFRGWQACQRVYSETYRGGYYTDYNFSPTDWYENDPESPDRFRAFSLFIAAGGSGNIFNQVGARVRLENVGLTMVPAGYNNYQRYLEGCEMPRHG